MISSPSLKFLLFMCFLFPCLLSGVPGISPFSSELSAQPLQTIRAGMWVRDLAGDPAGRVWITLDREGILVLEPGEDVVGPGDNGWFRFNTGNSGLPNDDAPAVAPDGGRGVWFGSLVGGLAYLDHAGTPADRSDDRWAVYTPESTGQGLPDPFVYSIVVQTGGLKWIGTQKGGLCCLDDGGTPLDMTDDRWMAFAEKEGLACPWVYRIIPRGTTGRWLATWGGGLQYMDDRGTPFAPEDDRWVSFSRADGLPGDKVRTAALDPSGGMWIATLGGLSYLDFAGTPFDKKDDRWAHFLPADGLPNINVMDVAVLPDGTVWVALWGGGLARLNNGGTPLNKGDDQWKTFGEADGLTELIVRRLLTDPRGVLWIATWGDGLLVHAFSDVPEK